jgi:leader peptidase (prepilin peptidase)/N-methyltransferase
MPDALPLALFLCLSGAAMGSFLAAWADRLARGESIVAPPSACRACGRRIGWRDLVPVVSWLWLGGRCRGCGAAIPARLLHAELGGVALAALAILAAATPAEMALGALLLWLLMGLALCDLAAFRLPDALTAALLVVGLALAWQGDALAEGLIGAGAGAGAFMAVRLGYAALRGREGLGLGDVKLMAGIGAALGWAALPGVALLAALAAIAVTVLGRRITAADAQIPFGAYLAAAAGVVWLLEAAGRAMP